MDFRYTIQAIEYEEFNTFLTDVSQDFIPPLLDRIDVLSLFDKLITYGTFITCYYDQTLVGLIAFYANNQETKRGYISLLAVARKFRGNRIASQLLSIATTESKRKGMTVLEIDTNRKSHDITIPDINFSHSAYFLPCHPMSQD